MFKKFPAPLRREFRYKLLILLVKYRVKSHAEAGIDEIPCKFPASRELRLETGSYLTTPTTIQSYETANPGADSRWAVSVGIFAGIVRPVTLAVSQANLGSRLPIQKFRSPRQGFGGQCRPLPGILGVLGPKAHRFDPGP